MVFSRIDFFDREFRFLSNFAHSPLEYEGIPYLNVEAAFQAQKTMDMAERRAFSELNPSEAKRKGRHVQLRPDWEEVKESIMLDLIRIKFSDPKLKQKLVMTQHATLIEGNTWHDNTWGDCSCPRCSGVVGKNLLGKILMKVRAEYRSSTLHYSKYLMTEADFEARKKIAAYHKEVAETLRSNAIDSQLSKEDCDWLLEEDDCLSHLYQDGCGDQYIVMAQEAAKRGFKKVIDIGANTGYQHLYFDTYNIEFIGIESHPMRCLTPAPVTIHQAVYPIPMEELNLSYDKETTLCISSLCMGWLGDIEGMFKQASKDFKYVLCTMPRNSIKIAEKYFTVEHLDEEIYWLTSK